jgi:hypothetical protein
MVRRTLLENKELIFRTRVGGDRKKTTMYFECRHIKPNGSKCQSPALKGMPYCYFHGRLHRSEKVVARADDSLELPLLEDRSSIQVALSRILNALGSAKLDTRRAGLFLYGLQIASQNVERKGKILPYDAVESTTQDEDGDELAPEKRVCNPDDRCFDCPERDTCENFDPEDLDDDDENEEQ